MSETDQAKLCRIGENYSKLDADREQDSGLGLIICQEMVQGQGGRIWVESYGVGSRHCGEFYDASRPNGQVIRLRRLLNSSSGSAVLR